MSRYLLITAALLAVPTLAHAHHPSAGGGANSAGGIHTMSAATMSDGKFAIGINSDFVKSRRFSDEQLVEFAGEHIHAHSADYNLTMTFSGSYGITDNLMINFSIPLVQRENIRAGNHSHAGGTVSNTVRDNGDVFGLGDATLMGKYRFFNRDDFSSSIMFGLKAPTGETGKSHHGEKLEAEHQPGSGSWDPSLGLAVTRQFGSYAIDGSLLYTWGREGSQETDLGDRAAYGVSVSKRLGGEMHDHGHGVLHQHRALDLVLELNGEWAMKKQQNDRNDDNSGGTGLLLSPGIRYTSGDNWSAYASFGVPVKNNQRHGHPDTDYRLTLGVGTTF